MSDSSSGQSNPTSPLGSSGHEIYTAMMSREFNDADERSWLYSCPIVNHIMSSTWQGKQKITAIVHLNNIVHLGSKLMSYVESCLKLFPDMC